MKPKKIIIYIILISTLLSIVIAGCSNNIKHNKDIIIQPTALKFNHENLSESAKIIASRLNRFDSAAFDITEIAGKNQLKISFSENQDVNEVTRLLTQKGELKLLAPQNQVPVITGNDIESTDWGKTDSTTDNYYISINLKKSAVNTWADVTSKNIGKSIAIVLDDRVLAEPVVRSEIQNGKCMITGDFKEPEAKLMAILISSQLPCTFEIVK